MAALWQKIFSYGNAGFFGSKLTAVFETASV